MSRLAVPVRNEVAHFQPADPDWWRRAAEALRPLLAWREAGGFAAPGTTTESFREPWFLPGTRAALNGFGTHAVR